MFLNLKQSNKRGFSLVETVIYIGLMTVVLFSLVSLISSASNLYLNLKDSKSIENNAINIMNTINTRVAMSSKIDIVNTVFDNPIGSISLVSYDNVGHSTTSRVYMLNNRVYLSQNGADIGPLSSSDVRVTSLLLKNTSTSTIDGFKVEITIDNASSTGAFLLKKFYNSYILR